MLLLASSSHSGRGENDFTMWTGCGCSRCMYSIAKLSFSSCLHLISEVMQGHKYRISYLSEYSCFRPRSRARFHACAPSAGPHKARMFRQGMEERWRKMQTQQAARRQERSCQCVREYLHALWRTMWKRESLGNKVWEGKQGTQRALHQVSFPGGSWEYFSPHLAGHEKNHKLPDVTEGTHPAHTL